MAGLVSQLVMSGYMTSMALQRQELAAAQNTFQEALSASSRISKTDFSLCISGQGSDTDFKECLVCKALIGFGVYTLAALPIMQMPELQPQAVLPSVSTAVLQTILQGSPIRGPPSSALLTV